VCLRTWGRNFPPPATSLSPIHRRNMKQTARNNMEKVIENQVKHINPETPHAQWD